MSSVFEQVQEIFRGVFDRADLTISHESSAFTIYGWDSLTHINLISAVSKHFSIQFGIGELDELTNVGSLLDLIAVKLRQR